jgi:protein-S-isoprenylcysteine O-methyltransferase Ste14
MSVLTLAWSLPASVLLVLVVLGRWTRRRAGAALLATVWPLWSLLLVDAAARRWGWWHGPTADQAVPLELIVGWALLWGPIPLVITPRARLSMLAAVVVLVDLVLMPELEPWVVLGPDWLTGEVVAIGCVLLPAQLLGRWTISASALIPRATLHFVQFTAVALVLFPAWVLDLTGGPGPAAWPGAAWLHLPLLVGALLPGLAAVAAFAERGGGTPVPFDPPPRLVTSGPYAFVANPMQASFAAAWMVLASWSRDPWLAGASAMAVVFGVGLGAASERQDLLARHGAPWEAWRREVRAWWPRWRPHTGEEALLLVDDDDRLALAFAAFLERRGPVELAIVRRPGVSDGFALAPAGTPSPLRGAHAAIRSLEHLHLGWAALAWVLGLPGVRLLIEFARRAAVRLAGAPAG